jgi:hypothetical protein
MHEQSFTRMQRGANGFARRDWRSAPQRSHFLEHCTLHSLSVYGVSDEGLGGIWKGRRDACHDEEEEEGGGSSSCSFTSTSHCVHFSRYELL